MKLKQLLQQIVEIQQRIKASKCFICGGLPRDRYLDKVENIIDIDITTGDKTIENVSSEFANEFGKKYNISRKVLTDHSSIFIGKLKLDFSSNFIIPNINSYLKNPTNMQREVFSRDFTCNSLLLDFNLNDLYDPTKRGLKDIDAKIIRTCLEPKVTLTSNKNRVIRSIYLAAKLGFDIDQSIIDFVKANPESVKISSQYSLVSKINKALEYDSDRAVYFINKMNLWNYIPITKQLQPYYIKSTNV